MAARMSSLLLLLLLLLIAAAGGSPNLGKGDQNATAPAPLQVEEEGKRLTILVPHKVGFKQFASVWCPSDVHVPPHNRNSSCVFSGFAIEVFQTCIKRLATKRRVLYDFIVAGNDTVHPPYDDMVESVKNKEVDAIVGDFTITAQRMEEIDFTHPYIQSTLMMMVPYHSTTKSRQSWNFLKPFSAQLWASIAALFLVTGLVIFFLEHENPYFHEQGLGWIARLGNVFWFTSLTMFFSQRVDIFTRLGRVLTVCWLLVVLIITSSYTASLTSILSIHLPIPTIAKFQQLQKSNLSIGYQDGSFVKDYMEKYLKIKPKRLQMLVTMEDYEDNLHTKKVAAILDESPYLQTFLNNDNNDCKYTRSGSQIAYFGGFGFGFPKNSPLTNEISLEIVKLEQDGELQNIQDRWLGIASPCVSNTSATTNIPLEDFGGLFILVAIVYFSCIFLKMMQIYNQRKNQITPNSVAK